ncbi:hypothetical protein GmHk_20G057613 [Glycine max]|nr:hypothetical protein GmHk_20G057613 [Glycine max]
MKVEQLFACHHISEKIKVQLATFSFQGKKHIPSYYERELMDQLQSLRQGSMSVEEYKQQMELLLLRLVQLCIRVEQQLKKPSSKSYDFHSYSKKDQAQGILGAAPSKPKEDKGMTIGKSTPKTSSQARTNNIKCFKCLGRGHIAS